MSAEGAGREGACAWVPDDDGIYNTGCDEQFVFIDSGPVENRMRFCPYCGKTLTAERVDRAP